MKPRFFVIRSFTLSIIVVTEINEHDKMTKKLILYHPLVQKRYESRLCAGKILKSISEQRTSEIITDEKKSHRHTRLMTKIGFAYSRNNLCVRVLYGSPKKKHIFAHLKILKPWIRNESEYSLTNFSIRTIPSLTSISVSHMRECIRVNILLRTRFLWCGHR